MKKGIWIVLLLVVVFVGIFSRKVIAKTAYDILYESPCNTPKKYHLGSVDERFSLSREEYLAAIKEAGDIWEKASGKDLFTEDPAAGMVVNLIYDTRQSIKADIEQQDEALKEKDAQLQPEIEAYKKKVVDFEKRIADLNKDIEYWNQQGGAPEEEYEQLKARQKVLRSEEAALKAEAKNLSLETEEFNSKVQTFNQTIDQFDEALDLKPEGGLYTLDTSGERVDIYLYSTHEELINILAHELGHSLGMDHVNNEKSIMYEKTNEMIVPTKQDLAMLRIACEEQNVVKMKFDEFAISLTRMINPAK